MNKIIYLLAILFSFTLSINAQTISKEDLKGTPPISNKLKVTGNTIDKATGESIFYATVSFFQDNKLIREVSTDLEGNFSLILNADTYDITIRYIGYHAILIKDIFIRTDATNHFNFEMKEGLLTDIGYCSDISVPLSSLKTDTKFPHSIKEFALSSPSYNLNGYSIITSLYATPFSKYSNKLQTKFLNPFHAPISHIPIHHDRTSFDYIQTLIHADKLPPKKAVRIEEMINYYDYDYPTPALKTRPLAVFTELTTCPWNEENSLLHIGIQAKKLDTINQLSKNLVLLLDVSGSMSSLKKLPYIKEGLTVLVNNLRPKDNLTIITYMSDGTNTLISTSGSNKEQIVQVIDNISPMIIAGSIPNNPIHQAYEKAQENFIEDGNNRIIILTDNLLKIGSTTIEELQNNLQTNDISGIDLSFLSFGNQKFHDDQVKIITKNTDIRYRHIENLNSAKSSFLEELDIQSNILAKDLNIQIEFNPAYVGKYKLVGYEHRKLITSKSPDVAEDASLLHLGQKTTILYELSPQKDNFEIIDENLTYQKRSKELLKNREIARVNIDYKAPNGQKTWNFVEPIPIYKTPHDELTDKTKLAAAIAEFGLLLSDSPFKANASYTNVLSTLKSIENQNPPSKNAQNLTNKTITLINIK